MTEELKNPFGICERVFCFAGAWPVSFGAIAVAILFMLAFLSQVLGAVDLDRYSLLMIVAPAASRAAGTNLLTNIVTGICGGIAIAAVSWSMFCVRRQRRLRFGRCVVCDHHQPPRSPSNTCSECGFDPMSGQVRSAPGLSLRWYVATWLAACLALGFAFWLYPQDVKTHDLHQAITRRAEILREWSDEGRDISELGRASIIGTQYRFGWPWYVARVHNLEYWSVNPDGGAVKIAAPRNLSFLGEPTEWVLVRYSTIDDSEHSVYLVSMTTAMAYVLLSHAIAVLSSLASTIWAIPTRIRA